MGNWIFRPTDQDKRISDHDRAILDLKSQRDKLKKYSDRQKVSKNIEKEKEYAKSLVQLNREKKDEGLRSQARMALRRKKYQEKLLDQAQKTQNQVEEMIDTIEYTMLEHVVVEGLKRGNTTLSDLHTKLGGVEGVERTLDDVQESIDTQNEIDALIGGNLSADDDGSVLEELDLLIAAEAKANTAILSEAPAVPSDKPIGEKEKSLEKDKARIYA